MKIIGIITGISANVTAPVIVLAFVLVSCLRPGEERAEMDLSVGKGTAGGAAFSVENGLAAIRSLTGGEVELWAQSPVVRIRIVTGPSAVRNWNLTMNNAMPGATAVVESGDATAACSQGDIPTVTRCDTGLSENDTAVLRISPAGLEDGRALRFACVSDVQEAVDSVVDIFDRMNEDPLLRFVVSAGDLTSQGNRDELLIFQKKLKKLNVPFYSTAGNHEMGADPVNWHRLFGRFNVNFSFGNVHITLADSGNASIDPLVYDWLEGWLSAARDSAHVFVTHYPLIDPWGTRSGSFRSRKEAAKLLVMLAEGDVDLVLHGHIHSYYHYENGGISTYISGGGGAIPERFDSVGRHYLVIDADPVSGRTSVSRVDIH